MQSDFLDWFKSQYGECSNHGRIIELKEKIDSLKALLGQAECSLSYQQRLFDAETSALYGWNSAMKSSRGRTKEGD